MARVVVVHLSWQHPQPPFPIFCTTSCSHPMSFYVAWQDLEILSPPLIQSVRRPVEERRE